LLSCDIINDYYVVIVSLVDRFRPFFIAPFLGYQHPFYYAVSVVSVVSKMQLEMMLVVLLVRGLYICTHSSVRMAWRNGDVD